MTSPELVRSAPRPSLAALRDELTPRHLLTSLNAGLILYLFDIIIVLSFGALVFSRDLASLLPFALGSLLLGAALMVATVALLGSYGGSMAVAQDAPTVVLGIAAAAIGASAIATDEDATLATIVVLIAGTTLLFGIVCLLLGLFRLGALVRFLPYPVLGGFLAGTGWLLVMGGLRVTTSVPMGSELLEPEVLGRWLPALALGLVVFIAVRRWRNALVLPLICGLAVVAFYASAVVAGTSSDDLAADGWLLGPFPADIGLTLPFDPATLSQVSWPTLVQAAPLAAPAILLGAMGLLLNSSSIELIVRRELKLDRELVGTGSANIVSGLLGGLPGYASIGVTAVSHGLGQGRRLPGVVVAILLLATLLAGMAVLSLIPRMLLGGLLVYIGVALLHQWVIEMRPSFSRLDYLVVLTVLLVIGLTDLLWGVAVGLVLTIVLFVVEYSRVSLVRYEVTGADLRSRVSRSPMETDALRLRGTELVILALQDYVFFGTAHRLVERVRARMRETPPPGIRALVLDFERVTGLDSTALLGFGKLLQELREAGIELILTGLRPDLARQLEAGGIADGTGGVRVFGDLDRGVEHGEELVLASAPAEDAPSLASELASVLPDEPRISELLDRMRRVELEAGELVVQQGDEGDTLYLIESGQLTARLERPGRDPIRLRTLRPGGLFGEIGFFLGAHRSATVVADRASAVRVMTRREWGSLAVSDPDLAGLLQRMTIGELGRRVVDLNRTLDALLQ